MSFVQKAVHELVDDVLDRVKEDLDDYARIAMQDLEVFVDKLVRRVVKSMAIGLLAASMVSAGIIFSLIGLVAYLSVAIGPAAAWGVVGLGMAGLGAVLLYAILRAGRRGMRQIVISDRGN